MLLFFLLLINSVNAQIYFTNCAKCNNHSCSLALNVEVNNTDLDDNLICLCKSGKCGLKCERVLVSGKELQEDIKRSQMRYYFTDITEICNIFQALTFACLVLVILGVTSQDSFSLVTILCMFLIFFCFIYMSLYDIIKSEAAKLEYNKLYCVRI